MKKLFLLIGFLLFSAAAQSQVLIALLLGDKLNTGKIEFGLDGGVNFANINSMDSNDWFRKWNLGFYFDIKMKEQWYLNTGVLVKSVFVLQSLLMLPSLSASRHSDRQRTVSNRQTFQNNP